MTDSFLTAAGWPRVWVQWVVLGMVLGVGLFVQLGAPEIGLMEARNFVAAREIHAGGSWLLPTMNGELRLAKPPLPTWLVAAVMQLTGSTTDLGLLRLPSAFGACLLVLFFWALARRLTPPADQGRTAWLASLVLASSLLLLTAGRDGNGWDVYCYCFMMGAVAAVVRGLQSAGRALGWFAIGGGLIGLSILSKGPVAPYGMLLPFLLAYALRGDRVAMRRQLPGWLVLAAVALMVGGAWPLYVLSQHLNEASHVAQTETGSWANRHVQPLWYYVNFPVFMGLWTLPAVAALVWPYAGPRVRSYAPYALLLAWLLATLVLLSLVPEKKERYLLPVLPPLALLTAGLVRHWLSSPHTATDKWLPRVWAGVLCLVLVALPVALRFVGLSSFASTTARYWLTSGCALAVAGGIAWLWARGRPAYAAVGGSLAVVILASGLLMPAYPEWQRRRDDPGLRPLALVVAQRADLRTLPVYSVGEMHIKWIWAAQRVVPQLPAEPLPLPLPLQQLPVVVYTSTRGPAPFPADWLRRYRISTIDSFDLSHQFADGRWYVTRIDAK
ncbi:ArnT family glycosyltransferase [Hymenobacter sp. CRA2]|uniref:ArnT family glycosyltransferase n=1 Tax=Hymenobacter sp. CRA2 TaxID=1955620 RepID=UPI00098E8F33|nr:hypothetical protein [Hymenobacter sp. CRA2]OON67631.1 hypothetical protein B0919_17560 [Hymenobacter sp. CRA2]